MKSARYILPAHMRFREPELLFHPERKQDRSPHPLLGLVQFGPYSRSMLSYVEDPLRVAVIASHGDLPRVDGLLAELETRASPRERKQYLVDYPGCSKVFGIRIVAASPVARLELSENLESEITTAASPHLTLAQAVTQALGALRAVRSEFDVIVVYLPTRYSHCFYGREGEGFDLHDYVKAVAAVRGLPVQIVREDKALSYPCRCSVMWRLAIALYCKAGGVPWKLAEADPDCAFIGLSYAVREDQAAGSRFVTCCSQVFDADGVGLEFVAYETGDVHVERDNPFLSRTEMHRVMSRSMSLYQRRHGGRVPLRMIVHKSTEFKRDEMDGCFDALSMCPDVRLIQVQQDAPWRGLCLSAKNVAGGYPCERGTTLSLGGREVALWTQGNAPDAVQGRDYYKEGKGIPSPLILRRFAGHGSWDDDCRLTLALTKMDWNNDGLYDRLPVTMRYAQVLARVIKRMPQLDSRPYEFRYFM